MQEITPSIADVPVASCPQCHQPIREQDYFCPNCGKNLKPAPPSTSVGKQIMLYVGSLLLPPIGVVWAVPYLRQPDTRSKMVGFITLAVTAISLILSVIALQGFYNYINDQVNQATQQINRMQGL